MYIDKDKISIKELKRISVSFTIAFVIIFITLLFMLWHIQIIRNDYYSSLAIDNIYKVIDLKAPRGLIVDRNGLILADNKINFTLYLDRENLTDLQRTKEFAKSITGLSDAEIDNTIDKYTHLPSFYPVPLKKNLSLDKVIFIESRPEDFPEFKIDIEPTRAYPQHNLAAHILGYVSEISQTELESKKDQGYKLGDSVGKSGVEWQYENFLQGKKGLRHVIKDNLGRVQEILNEQKPIVGATVELTIDIQLQKYIREILKDNNGTVGVLDLKTGGILALVTKPSFDPELFSGTFDQNEWLKMLNDPEKPLHNKFLQGFYSPGSVFKIVMALAALQEKAIDTNFQIFCIGKERIYDRDFHCWKEYGHGTMNIYDALKNSCNIYFYQLGKKLDIDTIAKYASYLGLGNLTGIDLPNETEGLVPTRAYKEKRYNQPWFPGETISIAIGHGLLNVTPAQILQLISTVALRGKIPAMHLIKRVISQNKVIQEYKPTFKDVPIDRAYFDIVIEGLYRVVNKGGTARAGMVKGLDICGKTGTSQVLSKENPKYKRLVKQKKFRPHSWFASFAPRDNPAVAMVVFIENGGDAGVIAAPLAAKIYQRILSK